jgi:hypothetical protein
VTLIVLMTPPLVVACTKDDSKAVQIVCPEIRKYTKAEQDAALAEYKALPSGSAIRLMVGDYKQLRDRIRVCGAKK